MEIPSTEVQNNFGQYLKFAQFEDVIVTRNGKRIAIIKSCEGNREGESSFFEGAAAYKSDQHKISYEEFLELSENSDSRYEFIDGEVYLLASPSYIHQCAVVEILNAMYQWFKGKSCKPLTAPFDVTLLKDDAKNVVQPDIVVVCDTENVNQKGRYTGTPTLVVEVLSESTQNKDMLKKLNLYVHSGVREYWIVNPFNQEIYIYYYEENNIKDYKVFKDNDSARSMIFAGLEINLPAVFAI